MSFENQIHLLDVSRIIIRRDERQRRSVDDDRDQTTLQESIRRNGLINPIVVRGDGIDTLDPILVAGERRLRAFKALGLSTIPARFVHELDPLEAAIIELEENIARKDLSWQDTARAVVKLHELHIELDDEWTQYKTAEAISLDPGTVSRYMKISPYFDDPRIMDSQTINKADSIISVIEGRRREAAINVLFDVEEEDPSDPIVQVIESAGAQGLETGLPPTFVPFSDISDISSPSDNRSPNGSSREQELDSDPVIFKRAARDIKKAILNQDFIEWATSYDGRKFNFVHVDFPYGATEVGPQMQGNEASIYADSPDIYLNLLNCFCENLDAFFAKSGWIMFWYSERMGQITRDTFKYKAPSLTIQTHPLIWFHSDNAGISPDHTRYPRHIYDTALLISRGNMPLVRMKSDAYACPTDRKLHPSTKPEPMLKFFFEMFMDEHTSILDPTCGAGSSLRAAESLGCRRTLGIEANEEYANIARHELQDRRNLYSLMNTFTGREEDE